MSAFESERFASAEELLRMLRERADDFNEVRVQVPKDILMRGPNGEKTVASNCCGSLQLCNGGAILIHRDDLQMLINDGILHRLRIPVTLSPP